MLSHRTDVLRHRILSACAIAALSRVANGSSFGTENGRTYRLLPDRNGWRNFSFGRGYGGAYTDLDVLASLEGTFGIEIDDYGLFTVRRFDVRLVNILDQGNIDAGWMDGDPLALKLYVNPIGLGGYRWNFDEGQIVIGHVPFLTLDRVRPSHCGTWALHIRP